ncbi:MAG TPA: hypothetical protein VGU22_00900 [Methylomirabilota bacterium]|jgi:hypothetical protein|nr:hypothetical protein [Methylomirabilota bacterium]
MADGSKSLQQAASTIFVVTAMMPLLVFMWTLHTLGVLHRQAAQVGLGLSLVFALLGFFVLRATMRRLTEFTRSLTNVAEPSAQALQQAAGVEGPPDRTAEAAPAVGPISEFGELTAVIASLWSREAFPLIGRPVVVSIVRASEPLVGTLKEVNQTGLLLEQNGQDLAISYQRVSGIEPQD